MKGALVTGLLLAAAATCFVAGCVVEAGSASAGVGIAVTGPPPEPVQEVRRPPPPNVQVVWIPGYWHWTGMQYTWIPGHWEQAPPGASWRAPHYSIRDGTYFYEPGAWAPR